MRYVRLLTLIPLALLAACGGGNNDAPGDNPTSGPTLGISNGNGLRVAQVTYQSAASSGDIASLTGNTGLTGNAGGGLSKPDMANPGIIDHVLLVTIGPLQLPCAMSGMLTITADLDDATGQTLTAGDTITAEYDACDDGVGETLDGTLDFEVISLTGDVLSGAYDMTMSMVLTDFQSTTATDVVMAHGDGTATINTLAAPYVEASVSGSSMTTDTNSAGQTLTNYSSAQTVDAGVIPSPYTLIASGTLDSSELTGIVTYSTPVMFEGYDANYPHIGEMLIVGVASSARVIAQANGIDVVIEIYANTTGTGTPESTINTTWTELAGL